MQPHTQTPVAAGQGFVHQNGRRPALWHYPASSQQDSGINHGYRILPTTTHSPCGRFAPPCSSRLQLQDGTGYHRTDGRQGPGRGFATRPPADHYDAQTDVHTDPTDGDIAPHGDAGATYSHATPADGHAGPRRYAIAGCRRRRQRGGAELACRPRHQLRRHRRAEPG